MTPTARTLRYLRQRGYAADVVERWLPRASVRRDLFRCIDVVAVKPGHPVLGVQATSATNIAARVNKAKSIPELSAWLGAGAAFQVFGWAQVEERWHPRIVELRAGDLEAVALVTPPRKRRASRWRSVSLFQQETTPS